MTSFVDGSTIIACLLVTVSVLSILLLLLYFWKSRRVSRLLAKIPGPPGIPLLGNLFDFVSGDLAQHFKVVKRYTNIYGKTVKAWFGPFPIVLISNKDDIKRILGNREIISRGPIVYELIKGTFLNGLFVSEGDIWRSHRKIIQSTFHNNVLNQFVDNFAKNAGILTERLKKVADGESFNMYHYMTQCTLDVVFETTLAHNINAQEDNNMSFEKRMLKLNDICTKRCTNPWLINEKIFNLTNLGKEYVKINNFLHGIVDKIVKERINNNKENGKEKCNIEDAESIRKANPALLDLMIDIGQLSDFDIKGEVMSMVGAGAESTATTCCYTLLMLGEHQQVQEKVLEEQRHIFRDNFLRPVVAEDVPQMTYLEQVIKETMRILPPVGFLFRKTDEEIELEDGYILPAGVFTVISVYNVQRDPEVYPEPNRFDPERFSLENSLGRHPFAYIPFGAGRRICVGAKYSLMEAKTILSTLLRRYQFLQSVGGVSTVEDKLELGLLSKPKGGFLFKIVPRSF